MILYLFLWITLFLPTRILYPTRVINQKFMPKKRGILACNHLSMIDAVYVAVYTKRKMHFFAKKELQKNFMLRWMVPGVGSVFVERGQADIAAVKKVLQILKKEKILLIFPEGTRNLTTEDIKELKTGAVTFSVKTGAPIVPIIIWRRPKFFRRNYIYFGKPFSFEQFKDIRMTHDDKAAATAILTEKMAETKEELRQWLLKKRPHLLKRHEAEMSREQGSEG